jgi:hypothetical protein
VAGVIGGEEVAGGAAQREALHDQRLVALVGIGDELGAADRPLRHRGRRAEGKRGRARVGGGGVADGDARSGGEAVDEALVDPAAVKVGAAD